MPIQTESPSGPLTEAKPKVLILSAPSGAGKTSLTKALVAARADAVRSVSHTTRSRRPDEVHGRDYYFVDRQTFEQMIREQAFLEYARVFDQWYGTARAPIEAHLRQGRLVVLDIDWQGARNVLAQIPDAVTVFVLPPSLEVLEQRLRERRQDSEAVIRRRMAEAVAEMAHYDEYQHLVVNDDFDAALEDLIAIVGGRAQEARPCAIDPAGLIHGCDGDRPEVAL